MKDVLKELIRAYPTIPSHALWRAVEAGLLSRLDFEYPLLDLGCGDGNFGKVIFDRRRLGIYGCDKDAADVAVAASSLIYDGVAVADALYLPYKDSSFATVLSNCVLEHICQDELAVSETSRVLRPGGRFVFPVPSENSERNLRSQSSSHRERVNSRLGHFHYRSPREWDELLKRHGIELESATYYFPKATQRWWELMMQLSLARVMGKEVSGLLASRKVGLYFLARAASPVLLSPLLRALVARAMVPDKDGGALLIQCHRKDRAV